MTSNTNESGNAATQPDASAFAWAVQHMRRTGEGGPVITTASGAEFGLDTARGATILSEYRPLADYRHIGHLDLTKMYPLYYLRTYDDLRNAFGEDAFWAARDHWVSNGRNEGRSPTPFFDPKYYRDIHPDLAGMDYKQVTEHWVNHGIGEGRRGSRVFHLKYYWDTYPDLQAAYPGPDYLGVFDHWKRHGHLEGRRTTADGPRLVFFQADASFGVMLDQPHFFGLRHDDERFICGIGYILCIMRAMQAPDDERCRAIVERCDAGRDHYERVFRDQDRNQYHLEQMERNRYTA